MTINDLPEVIVEGQRLNISISGDFEPTDLAIQFYSQIDGSQPVGDITFLDCLEDENPCHLNRALDKIQLDVTPPSSALAMIIRIIYAITLKDGVGYLAGENIASYGVKMR
jgi:hypothetical protein